MPSPARLRCYLSNACIALVSILMVLLCAEVILRFESKDATESAQSSEADSTLHCERDSSLGWILPPNATGVYDCYLHHILLQTNSWGIRSPEVDARDSTRFRILVLGDSYAFGWGVPEEDAFPRQLERMLCARFPTRFIEVINAAIPGYGIYQQTRMLEHIQARVRVDAVISTLSLANDPLDGVRIARYVPGRLHLYDNSDWRDPGCFLSRVIRKSHLLSLLDKRTRTFQLNITNAGPSAARQLGQSLDVLLVNCSRCHVPILIVIVPRRTETTLGGSFSRWIARQSTRIAHQRALRVARSYGIPVLDLKHVLSATERKEGAYLKNDAHWSPAAHRAVAATILDSLPRVWLSDSAQR